MSDDLPEHFDLIVAGTGFVESCVAAAASRIGKTVLHIDRNDYYGGSWASFNLKSFNDLLENCADNKNEIANASFKWFIPEKRVQQEIDTTEENEQATANSEQQRSWRQQDDEELQIKDWTQMELLEITRQFSIDLVPRVLFATGELVKLLISSNICRYAEFRAVDHVCTMFEGKPLVVPCSRSDVFNTRDLSIVEKRLLMKFLNYCLSVGETRADELQLELRDCSFGEHLKSQNLTEKISTCIRQAIAMCSTETPFTIGLERTQIFLRSLGHYGNTPFLFPQYGSGELPQCFCRLCAVFGGIYYLHHGVKEAKATETNGLTVTLDTGKCIRAQHMVMSAGNMANLENCESQKGELVPSLSRGVFLCNKPLGDGELNSGGGGVNLLRLVTPNEDREGIFLQLARFTGTCPKGVYLMHLTTEAVSDNPEKDLEPFTQQIFNGQGNCPNIIYAAHFTIMRQKNIMNTPERQGIFCTQAPQYELDYDKAIKYARALFADLYGNDVEFLPRAPDPEEIVVEGEDPIALHAHELPEDLRAQLRALEQNAADMHMSGSGSSTPTKEQQAEESMDAE